jgi:6-pyruvoyltetrahydropterin/6-carboxytetrahydropterin synthase
MSMKVKAIRRFQFCAGHRVHNHESKCNNMHGHNYVMFAHAEASKLDALGRVIDFSEIKRLLGEWIDTYLDHGFIYFVEDKEVIHSLSMVKDQKVYRLANNPTAENIAEHILHDVCPVLFERVGIKITKIVLWETENCYVEASL